MNIYKIMFLNKRGMRQTIIYHADNETEARDRFLSNPKNKRNILLGISPA